MNSLRTLARGVRDSLRRSRTGRWLERRRQLEAARGWTAADEPLRAFYAQFVAPGDLVFDPFCGSGTVPVVCERLGRGFVACEINADYCRMAEERLVGADKVTESEHGLLDFSGAGRNRKVTATQACLV